MIAKPETESRAKALGRRAVFLCGVLAVLAAVGGETCSPYVESMPRWGTAMLRSHTDAFADCIVDESTYVDLVREWLKTGLDDESAPDSLGLGRLVAYPWLSRALAQGASSRPDWDPKKGRSRKGDANGLVASVLSEQVLMERLGAPFAGSGYRVSGISVEKVLVGPASSVLPAYRDPDALLPYDAQAWLTLEARAPAR